MKTKYIIFSILMFLFITPSANASICGKSDLLRVKGDANSVTINYELVPGDEFGNISGLFDLKINGITDDLIIIEQTSGRTYTSKSNVNGVITIENVSGENFIFKLYYQKCDNKLMRTIRLNLPKYNYYSNNKLCEGISEEELDICGKWYQGELNDDIFKQKIEEYQKSLEEKKQQEEKENTIFKQIVDFLLDYYLYIIITIVIIVIITMMIVLRKRRYSLE